MLHISDLIADSEPPMPTPPAAESPWGSLFKQGAHGLESRPADDLPSRARTGAVLAAPPDLEDARSLTMTAERPALAETLRRAIARKEWTISRAAREADVDRSFLSRLISGHPPPRARDGRLSAELDARYAKIAQALSLDEGVFLDQVVQAQEATVGRDPDEYGTLLSQALASLQRGYDPEVVSELNLLIRQLGPAMRRAGGSLELYRELQALPALPRARRGLSGGVSELQVNNHKGKDPLWEDDQLPPLSDALIELGYRCHTVEAEVGLDVRFDMAAVLQKMGTRDPDALRTLLGLHA